MLQTIQQVFNFKRSALFAVLITVFFLFLASGITVRWRSFLMSDKTEEPELKVQPLAISSELFGSIENTLNPELFQFNLSSFKLLEKSKTVSEKLKFEIKDLVIPRSVEFPELSRKDGHLENIQYSDKSHGFFSNSIMSIQEDKKGYLWFGSEGDGLCISNGHKAWIYRVENGLRSDVIKHIFADSHSRIWLCWDKGVSFVKDSRIYHVSSEVLDDAIVVKICEDLNGQVWFCTKNKGLIKLQGSTFETYDRSRGLPGNEINDIAFGRNGKLFIAAAKSGLLIINGKEGKQFADRDTVAIEFSPISICKDRDRIWMGSYYGSQYYFEQGKLFRFKMHGKYERCFKILKNEKGIWYADYSFGVHLIRKDGKIKSFGMEHGLTDRNAFDIVFDHNNNIWVADPFSGVSMIHISPFSLKRPKFLYPTRFQKENDTTILISSNGSGIYRWNGKRVVNYNVVPDKEGLTLHHSWDALLDDKGELWSSTHGIGIAHVTGNKMVYYKFTEGNVINDLTKDKSGNIWFSTYDGLRLYDWESKRFSFFTKKQGLKGNFIHSTTIDSKERMWICTDSGVNVLYKKKITSLNKRDGLCSANIHTAYEDKNGNVWFLSVDQGLSVLIGEQITNIGTKNGLISNKVVGIVQDDLGRIWISSASGLSCIKLKERNKFNIENFTHSEGGFMFDFTKAMVNGFDGKLLFGTSKGVVEFDPYMVSPSESRPKLEVEKFTIDNSPAELTADKELKVFNDSRLMCEVSLLHWGHIKDVQFFYALKKRNTKSRTLWHKVDHSQPFLIDTRLKSGKYNLHFKVVTKHGTFDVLKGGVLIRTQWFDSWWFYAVVLLILLGSFYMFLRLRLRYLRRKRTELERTVMIRTQELKNEKEELSKANAIIQDKIREKDTLIYEMHHRVKNNLQTISSLLDLQLNSLQDEVGIRVLKDAVRRISAMSTSHELLYSTQEDLSEVNLNMFIRDLMIYQKSIILDRYYDSFIRYDLEPVVVSVSTAISVGMIISECISNSVKHAFTNQSEPEILVRLKGINGQVILSVEDNGSGWPKNEQNSEKLGLKLVRIFTKKIGGRMELKSDENGTIVTIVFNPIMK